jgi:hypothetical protein
MQPSASALKNSRFRPYPRRAIRHESIPPASATLQNRLINMFFFNHCFYALIPPIRPRS